MVYIAALCPLIGHRKQECGLFLEGILLRIFCCFLIRPSCVYHCFEWCPLAARRGSAACRKPGRKVIIRQCGRYVAHFDPWKRLSCLLLRFPPPPAVPWCLSGRISKRATILYSRLLGGFCGINRIYLLGSQYKEGVRRGCYQRIKIGGQWCGVSIAELVLVSVRATAGVLSLWRPVCRVRS